MIETVTVTSVLSTSFPCFQADFSSSKMDEPVCRTMEMQAFEFCCNYIMVVKLRRSNGGLSESLHTFYGIRQELEFYVIKLERVLQDSIDPLA